MAAYKLAICIISIAIIIALFIIFINYFNIAFPSLECDNIQNKSHAIQVANEILESIQYRIYDFKVMATLERDDEAIYYLQRVVGYKKLKEIIKKYNICLCYWRIRYYQTNNMIEYIVGIDERGDFDGFTRKIAEDYIENNISEKEAFEIAANFVSCMIDTSAALYKFEQHWDSKQNARVDHLFLWQREIKELQEAREEILIIVQGNKIGLYERYINIPDAFKWQLQREKSYRELLQRINSVIILLMCIIAVIMLIYKISKREHIEWKVGIYVSSIGLLLTLIIGFNGFNEIVKEYAGNSEWWIFILNKIIGILYSAIIIFLKICLFILVGISLNKEIIKINNSYDIKLIAGKIRLNNVIVIRCAIGYILAAILLGYHTLFYIIANKYNVILPLNAKYVNSISIYLPFVSFIGSSMLATLIEDIPYRLYLISLLNKVIKNKYIAVIISAIIWAGMHSGQIAYPIYIRIIELSIVGIIYGCVFIKYGIIPVMIAHYLVNAIIGPTLDMESSSNYYRIGLAITIIIPIIIIYIASLLSGLKSLQGHLMHD